MSSTKSTDVPLTSPMRQCSIVLTRGYIGLVGSLIDHYAICDVKNTFELLSCMEEKKLVFGPGLSKAYECLRNMVHKTARPVMTVDATMSTENTSRPSCSLDLSLDPATALRSVKFHVTLIAPHELKAIKKEHGCRAPEILAMVKKLYVDLSNTTSIKETESSTSSQDPDNRDQLDLAHDVLDLGVGFTLNQSGSAMSLHKVIHWPRGNQIRDKLKLNLLGCSNYHVPQAFSRDHDHGHGKHFHISLYDVQPQDLYEADKSVSTLIVLKILAPHIDVLQNFLGKKATSNLLHMYTPDKFSSILQFAKQSFTQKKYQVADQLLSLLHSLYHVHLNGQQYGLINYYPQRMCRAYLDLHILADIHACRFQTAQLRLLEVVSGPLLIVEFYVRAADLLFKQKNFHSACVAFWIVLYHIEGTLAVEMDHESEVTTNYPAISNYCLAKLALLMGKFDCIPETLLAYTLYSRDTLSDLEKELVNQLELLYNTCSKSTTQHIIYRAISEKRAEKSFITFSKKHSRSRTLVYMKNYFPHIGMLPRFFSWIYSSVLSAMSTPKDRKDIKALSSLGVKTVITLTEETPLPFEWFENSDVENLYLPTLNYEAPSVETVDICLREVLLSLLHFQERKVTSATLIHCGGGKGRAGTVLACIVARLGEFLSIKNQLCSYCRELIRKERLAMSVASSCEHEDCMLHSYPSFTGEQAIAYVRMLRPGSIETAQQEDFVSKYVSIIWKRSNVKKVHHGESWKRLEADTPMKMLKGKWIDAHVIVLCGLPASGKSTFADHVCQRSNAYKRISRDEIGSTSGAQQAVSNYLGKIDNGKSRIIIDQVNESIEKRDHWLRLLLYPDKTMLIWFDVGEEVCIMRGKLRQDHPTLESRRAEAVVKSFAKRFEEPRQDEAFDTICHVSSGKALGELYAKFGLSMESSGQVDMELQLHKFPRTRHLLNLGSATRDDLVMSQHDCESFLNPEKRNSVVKLDLILEEKVDGANLGISYDSNYSLRVQNRSHFVNSRSHSQFKKLDKWLLDHADDLHTILTWNGKRPGDLVLFGEWLYAKHSIHYEKLPDWFLAFDLFDVRMGRFYSRKRFYEILDETKIKRVPLVEFEIIAEVSIESVKKLVRDLQSNFYQGPVEGVYFRLDDNEWLVDRAKIVRENFIAGNEHWSKGMIVTNGKIWE